MVPENHHIIIDATGRRLLTARTACRYRALRFGEPLSALDAATPEELLAAERSYAASNAFEIDRVYWLEQFAEWPGPLLDINRRNTERLRSGCAARGRFTLQRSDFIRLETAAREIGSSAFRAIVALTYVAFTRLYDRREIVFGLELANRSATGANRTIGLLARPVPMLLALDHTQTIAHAARQIGEITARNYPHRNYPVQELSKEPGITRRGYHGLFDIIVNYIPAAYDFKFEESAVEVANLSYGFTTPWTLTIADTGSTRDLDVSIDTDPGLIPADVAARLAACLEVLLLRGLENPACQVASLPIMPEATRENLLAFSAGETTSLEETTLATLCAAQAELIPDAIALISGEQQLSFATIHAEAGRLARRTRGLWCQTRRGRWDCTAPHTEPGHCDLLFTRPVVPIWLLIPLIRLSGYVSLFRTPLHLSS